MWHYGIKTEFQKIVNFLDKTSGDKVYQDLLLKMDWNLWLQWGNYSVNKQIRIKKSMLRSDSCDFSDAYIFVKGTITIVRPNNAKRNKSVAFKNNALFINCISKINDVKIDNAEDLDVLMPMYNLLEYYKNYRKTTGSLWKYYRDEPIDPLSSESFKYKKSITGNTYNINVSEAGYDPNKVGKNETEVVIPLKHSSNFWRSLNIPLINCKV